MPRFVFELEPVLELRERVEREKQLVVAGWQAKRVAVEEKIRAVHDAIAAGRQFVRQTLSPDGLAAAGGGAGAMAQVRLSSHTALHMSVQVQRLAIELAGIHQKQQAARQELLKATVARKAVETLRARRFAAWQAEQKRLETAQLDEINTQRAALAAGDLA